MTFSSLCEYLAATPTRQLSILKEQKYPRSGPVRRYDTAMNQLLAHLVDGQPLDPDADGLEPHEQELLSDFRQVEWENPADEMKRPWTQQGAMQVQGVEISVMPDLLLENEDKVGALKFYLPKTRELDATVGLWMASFLYQYEARTHHKDRVDPSLCMIYDVRKGEFYGATKSYKRLFQQIESACQMISRLWPTI